MGCRSSQPVAVIVVQNKKKKEINVFRTNEIIQILIIFVRISL